jgi:excisionase family DNA binding protein
MTAHHLDIPDYLTAPELASKMKLHVSTIRHEIAEGRLPATKWGSGYRIDPKDVDPRLELRRVPAGISTQPVPLRRGNPNETQFGKMAREMEPFDAVRCSIRSGTDIASAGTQAWEAFYRRTRTLADLSESSLILACRAGSRDRHNSVGRTSENLAGGTLQAPKVLGFRAWGAV